MSSRQPSKRNAGRAGQSQDAATPVVQVSPMNVDEENVDAAPLEAAQEAVAAMTMAASSTATPVAAQDTHDEAQPSNIQQPNTSAKSASVTTRQGNGKGKWKAKGRKGRKPGRSAAAGGKAQEKPVKTSGLGRGKGPRGGQSHKRARLDLGEEVSSPQILPTLVRPESTGSRNFPQLQEWLRVLVVDGLRECTISRE